MEGPSKRAQENSTAGFDSIEWIPTERVVELCRAAVVELHVRGTFMQAQRRYCHEHDLAHSELNDGFREASSTRALSNRLPASRSANVSAASESM